MSKIREDYTDRIKQQLDEFNEQIDHLEIKLQQAKAEVRANYRIEMAKLRLQQEQVASTFEQLRTEGANNWEELVHEMDKVRNAFSHALKDFKSQL